MEIGVSSYSFAGLLKNGGLDLFGAMDRAKEMGFDCFEFTEFGPPEGETYMGFASRLRLHAEKIGLRICNYAVSADFLYGKDGDGDARKETERVKRQVDITKELGAATMRHDAAWGYREKNSLNHEDAIKTIAPFIREVSEYANALGIRTMCENHGYFIQDSARMAALVREVACENFGLLVDVGNFVCADEDPAAAVANVARYAFHAHAKDFLHKPYESTDPGWGWFPTRSNNQIRGTVIGHGVVPVAQCVAILKKSGYDGVISVEFEGMEETFSAIRLGKDYLAKLLR